VNAPHDLRLVPAALTAWVFAALALTPGVWLAPAAVAVMLLAWRLAPRGPRRRGTGPATPNRVHQVLLCAAVAVAIVVSARAQVGARLAGGFEDLRAAGADVVVTGVALEDARELGPWSTSAAMVAVRLEWIADGGTAAGGTAVGQEVGGRTAARVTALGEVTGVVRGERLELSGQLVALADSSDAQALLVDARVGERAPPRGVTALFGHLRADFVRATGSLGAQGRGLVPGIAIGDDSALPDTLREAMRRTSLGHLTAVSGAHIALVLAIVGVLGARAPTRARALLILVALGCLVALVGSEASVVRAAAMGCTAVVAMARGRPPRAVPALATGIVVLLVVDPWLAFSFGFALSVSATAALLLLAPALGRAIARPLARTRLPPARGRMLATLLALPLAAHLACAPIIVLFNPSLSMYGVLANAVANVAVAPATVLGLAGVLAAPVSLPAATWLARGAEVFTGWIAGTATLFSQLPHSAVAWPGGLPGALALAALHAAVALLLLRVRRVRPVIVVVALVLALLVAIASMWPGAGRVWSVRQCDVGQGSALLVRSGTHSAVMVDVGPEEGRSQECLEDAGVTHLDLLVLTHPHADHVGNLAAVLAAASVDRVLVSPATEPAGAVRYVAAELAYAGLEPETGLAGRAGRAGEVEWEVLWPAADTGIADANDLSVIALLAAPGGRALGLGDLQGDGQAGLADAVATCGERCRGVEVVAMAHHGSRDQDQALARLLDPAITLVSVGENGYGHPTAEALSLYEGLGSALWRTDEDGAVVVTFDGTRAVVASGP